MSFLYQPFTLTPLLRKGTGCHREGTTMAPSLWTPIVPHTYSPVVPPDPQILATSGINVWDQGQLHASPSYAYSFLDTFYCANHGIVDTYNNSSFGMSRTGGYYYARLRETPAHESVPQDMGCAIKNVAKVHTQFGAYLEDVNSSTVSFGLTNFSHHVKQQYSGVGGEDGITMQLGNNAAVAFGFDIFSSFEYTKSDGIVAVPDVVHETYIGSLAGVIVGQWKAKLLYKVRLSWGSNFGVGGYVWMPYDYVLNEGNTTFDFGYLDDNV